MTVHATTIESAQPVRPPPAAVKLLLPVWGYRYVSEFLEFGLPSLLAPGNIPALAKALPCEFLMMTSAEDAVVITEHPAWRKLQTICHATVELIDDLITGENHSTSITLAYSRAIRAAGPQMVDTCFINVCGDFVYSDGALENVIKQMNAGANGVLAGNFQFVAEDGLSVLRSMIDPARAELALSSRQLIRCGLAHLHPAAFANIVNFGLFHNEHTNRLFWRVDRNTLVGRFYLLHVVCVRPEVTEFVTGSSFDYSFIPELCPSNNVAVFTDSDDYFVLEIQARNHEARHLRQGPLLMADLVDCLAEWTTVRHRQNAQFSLTFHAEDIPDTAATVAAEAEQFVAQVTALLTAPPQPHRNHPYWIGAISAHRRAIGHAKIDDPLAADLGRKSEKPRGTLAMLWRLQTFFYGGFPDFGPCHPYWPDFRLPLDKLQMALAEKRRALIVSNTPHAYTAWLANRSPTTMRIESARFLNLPQSQYRGLFGTFDACLIHLTERDLALGDKYVAHVGPLLRPGGKLYLLINNSRMEEIRDFRRTFAAHAARFASVSLWLAATHYVPTSRWRAFVQGKIAWIGRMARRDPLFGLPLAVAFGPTLLLISYFCNKWAARGLSAPPSRCYCSSVFMEMNVTT